MVSEILANQARRAIFGYKFMVFSILAISILAFVVWAHHMFMTGMNPFVGAIFMFLTLLIAIPSAIKVFNWISTVFRGNLHFNPQMLFALGFVSTFISGGLTGIWLGNSAMDIPLHDTYFVVAHFHIVMGVSAFFGMIAGVYHWFPRMYGRLMNLKLGHLVRCVKKNPTHDFGNGLVVSELEKNSYPSFCNSFFNSLKLVAGSVLLCLAVSLAAGFSLAKLNPKGSAIIAVYLLVGISIPAQLYIVPLFLLWKEIHLLNTHIGLIIIYTALNAPFATFLIRSLKPNEADITPIDPIIELELA